MIRKIFAAVVLVPLGLLIVVFAVANRQVITVSFDPFGGDAMLSATMPLFVLVLVLMIAGVIIGGVAAWLRQAKWRRAARHARAEASALRSELDGLKRRLAPAERAGLPPPTSSTVPDRQSTAA